MKNIFLSNINLDNLGDLHELFSDSYITEFLSFKIDRKLKSARKFLYYVLEHKEKIEVLGILDIQNKLNGIVIIKYKNNFELEIEIILKRKIQNKGIGSYVLNKIISEKKKEGYKYVYANVHKDNLIGRNFVLRNRFKEYLNIEDRKIYIV